MMVEEEVLCYRPKSERIRGDERGMDTGRWEYPSRHHCFAHSMTVCFVALMGVGFSLLGVTMRFDGTNR